MCKRGRGRGPHKRGPPPLGPLIHEFVDSLRLYSFVLRLYSFRPSEMLFPLGFCIPFVAVCILTPFGEYNTISKREEYKSTKVRKCDSSIVLGARWPNGMD